MTKTTTAKNPTTMTELVELLGDQLVPFTDGQVIDVTVIAVTKDHIMVDVAGLATGIIPEKELSADSARFKAGDVVRAYVLSTENDNGYVILSLKKAEKEKLWNMLETRNTSGDTITVKIIQANKGGIVAQYGDMQGFIPVSQLSAKHYPRVNGDRGMIKQKLDELIGQTIEVKIMSYDKVSNKIIFSEKAAGEADLEEIAQNYEVGQRVNGKVTGIVDFGLFIDIGGIEALVHISQVSWQRINNLKDHFQVGQEVEAEVVSIDGGRVSLSMKKLQPDPWQAEIKTIEVGSKVDGTITRVTPYGAFVRISDNLEGLFHISQIADGGDQESPQSRVENIVEEGKSYPFEVVSIEPELRKISLKLNESKK